MKIIVFGATGATGKQIVLQGLTLGYSVTAFVRDKSKLADIQHPNLHFYTGNVLNPADVENAIKGHEAVFCALGDGRKGTVRSAGTLNIIKGMQKNSVRRLICQSTLGAGDSKGNLNFFWKYIMFGWFLKQAFLDHELQEDYIRESFLDWTIVRPGALTDGAATGNYRHGFSGTAKSLKLKVSKADVALFMLKQLTSSEYLKKSPGLSY